jgi:hypothetical protein|tara:strand:- start:595 stop:723 length:129 start_codon:yes stop_codon:yes gene_type:complete
MTDIIIHNLVFWPIWAVISMIPYWIMQSAINKGAALAEADRK